MPTACAEPLAASHAEPATGIAQLPGRTRGTSRNARRLSIGWLVHRGKGARGAPSGRQWAPRAERSYSHRRPSSVTNFVTGSAVAQGAQCGRFLGSLPCPLPFTTLQACCEATVETGVVRAPLIPWPSQCQWASGIMHCLSNCHPGAPSRSRVAALWRHCQCRRVLLLASWRRRQSP